MKMPLLMCRLGVALAMVLLGARASAQGCGLGVITLNVTCENASGTVKEQQVSTLCEGEGNPDDFCSQGWGECPYGLLGGPIGGASETYAPDECGGGGGGGGGGDRCDPQEEICPPDDQAVPGGPRHLFRRGSAAISGDLYYRNGRFYDGFAYGLVRAKRTTELANSSHLADVPLNQRTNLGGEAMKMSTILLAAVCTAPMPCAQQVATPAVTLKAVTKIGSSLSHPAGMIGPGNFMCDGTGNIYARYLDIGETDTRKIAQVPIQKITPDGVQAGNLRVADAFPDDSHVVGRSYFVNHDGRLYQAAMSHRGVFVVEYAQDGSVKAKTKLGLDSYVEVWHLAVFKSGEYLLIGTTGEDRRTPFTAVFAADGRLVKKIYEPEDEDARQLGKLNMQPFSPIDNSNNFVSGGDVASGSDGNVYLLRGGSPNLVYVISPVGDVVRKLRIDAGNPDLVASGIKSYAGRLAIGFDRLPDSPRNLIKIIDLKGNSITDYEVGVDAGESSPSLACFGSEGFTLLPAHVKTEVRLFKAKLP